MASRKFASAFGRTCVSGAFPKFQKNSILASSSAVYTMQNKNWEALNSVRRFSSFPNKNKHEFGSPSGVSKFASRSFDEASQAIKSRAARVAMFGASAVVGFVAFPYIKSPYVSFKSYEGAQTSGCGDKLEVSEKSGAANEERRSTHQREETVATAVSADDIANVMSTRFGATIDASPTDNRNGGRKSRSDDVDAMVLAMAVEVVKEKVQSLVGFFKIFRGATGPSFTQSNAHADATADSSDDGGMPKRSHKKVSSNRRRDSGGNAPKLSERGSTNHSESAEGVANYRKNFSADGTYVNASATLSDIETKASFLMDDETGKGTLCHAASLGRLSDLISRARSLRARSDLAAYEICSKAVPPGVFPNEAISAGAHNYTNSDILSLVGYYASFGLARKLWVDRLPLGTDELSKLVSQLENELVRVEEDLRLFDVKSHSRTLQHFNNAPVSSAKHCLFKAFQETCHGSLPGADYLKSLNGTAAAEKGASVASNVQSGLTNFFLGLAASFQRPCDKVCHVVYFQPLDSESNENAGEPVVRCLLCPSGSIENDTAPGELTLKVSTATALSEAATLEIDPRSKDFPLVGLANIFGGAVANQKLVDPNISNVFVVGFHVPSDRVLGRCGDLGFKVLGVAEVILDQSTLFYSHNPKLPESYASRISSKFNCGYIHNGALKYKALRVGQHVCLQNSSSWIYRLFNNGFYGPLFGKKETKCECFAHRGNFGFRDAKGLFNKFERAENGQALDSIGRFSVDEVDRQVESTDFRWTVKSEN
jgi:hypothetical protein